LFLSSRGGHPRLSRNCTIGFETFPARRGLIEIRIYGNSKSLSSVAGLAEDRWRKIVPQDGRFKNSRLQAAVLMKKHSQVAAFILAGGVSSRMGREKGLLEFGGEPLIVRTARLIEPLVTEVTLVGPRERYAALGLRVISDLKIGRGEGMEPVRTPLVGIASALNAAKMPWNLILACDLPYLTAAWLDWLLSRAVDSSAQIVMPRTSGGLEPLAAVYRRECAAPIAAALERGIRKVTDALDEFQMELLPENDWGDLDPEGRVLRNMNAPSDYESARKWFETK